MAGRCKSEFGRKECAEAIQRALPQLSVANAKGVLDVLLGAISEAFCEGKSVILPNFGTLSVRVRKAHIGRDPRNGEAKKVPARRYVFFKPSGMLFNAMNGKAKG